jgi:hypothetical protein
MNEPLIDPRDGHGARSASDVILLNKWNLALKQDRRAIIELVNLAGAHSQRKLKEARDTCVVTPCGIERFELRALAPAMTALGIAKVEEIEVPPERDGFRTVTTRKRIILEERFIDYALGRPGVDPKVVDGVRKWIAAGSIQRPCRLTDD